MKQFENYNLGLDKEKKIDLFKAFISEKNKVPVLNSQIEFDKSSIPENMKIVTEDDPWFKALIDTAPKLEDLLTDMAPSNLTENKTPNIPQYNKIQELPSTKFKLQLETPKQPRYMPNNFGMYSNNNIYENILNRNYLKLPNTYTNNQILSNYPMNLNLNDKIQNLNRKRYYI